MGAVLELPVLMDSLTCCVCGIDFAAPRRWVDARIRGDGGNRSFYCPNGHSQKFIGKTEAEQLREVLLAKDRELASERERRETAEREARAHHGAATRARNESRRIKERVGRGVCPCCNRTFQQLARHMTTKHPEYRGGA